MSCRTKHVYCVVNESKDLVAAYDDNGTVSFRHSLPWTKVKTFTNVRSARACAKEMGGIVISKAGLYRFMRKGNMLHKQ